MKNYFFAWSKLGAFAVILTMQPEPPKPHLVATVVGRVITEWITELPSLITIFMIIPDKMEVLTSKIWRMIPYMKSGPTRGDTFIKWMWPPVNRTPRRAKKIAPSQAILGRILRFRTDPCLM